MEKVMESSVDRDIVKALEAAEKQAILKVTAWSMSVALTSVLFVLLYFSSFPPGCSG